MRGGPVTLSPALLVTLSSLRTLSGLHDWALILRQHPERDEEAAQHDERQL